MNQVVYQNGPFTHSDDSDFPLFDSVLTKHISDYNLTFSLACIQTS